MARDRRFRAFLPLLSLVWLVFSSGCGRDAAQEAAALKKQVEELARTNRQLKEDLTRQETDLARARQALKEKDASLVAARIGLTRPDESLFATVQTSHGPIVIELYWKRAPYTVQNFVELAEGTREWIDPTTGQKVRRPLYDGTLFHRIIPGFMIQGGDPKGDGTGGPGYLLPDELDPGLHHDKPGVVAMANSGPDSNGSQFYILEAARPELDGKYTIFGQVTRGMEVVQAIAKVPTENERPKTPVRIERVRIGRGAPAG